MRVTRVFPPVVRAAFVVVCLSVALPAFAQQPAHEGGPVANLPAISFTFTRVPPAVAAEGTAAQPAVLRRAAERARPAALLPLYGSLVTLQALDIHSTRAALRTGGGREANPAMRPIVHNSAAFVAVKASSTAGLIWASERMWKHHPKTAIVFSAVVNTAMAAIVAHNYSIRR